MTTTEVLPLSPVLGEDATPAQVRQEWARRMESGLYEQSRSRLYSGQSFCALGVLADMAVETLGYQWVLVIPNHYALVLPGDDHRFVGILPPAVLSWAGIDGFGVQAAIITANDTGATFTELAETVRGIQ